MFTRNSDQSHIMFITKQIFNYQQNKTFDFFKLVV